MRHTQLPALALMALLAACSDNPAAPGDESNNTLNLDLATLAAEATAEDVDAMATMSGELGTITFAAALSDGPPQGPGNTNGCGFGGGRWNCPPNSANGLTITRSIAFFDEALVLQDAYDALTTDMIDVEMSLEGNVTRGPWTSETFRARHFEITGLAGEETVRTINGEGEEEVSRSGQPGNSPARSYAMVGDFTIDNVIMPVPGEGVTPWPLSGTITREYTVMRNDDAPVTRLVIITFDGTATPSATLNGEPFEIDLHERTARRR